LKRIAALCTVLVVPAMVGVAAAQTADGFAVGQVDAAAAPAAEFRRAFVDTGVSDVRLGDGYTVATMNRSPESSCPSNQYIYERDRAKWQTSTGRLVQAMKEGATVRISFTCRNGLQSINAIQFLTPPPPTRFSRATPQRSDTIRDLDTPSDVRASGQVSATGGLGGVPLP